MIVRCDCGREINTRLEVYWRFVEGWEKDRDQGGTNHIALRKTHDRFMCNICMVRRQASLHQAQESLI